MGHALLHLISLSEAGGLQHFSLSLSLRSVSCCHHLEAAVLSRIPISIPVYFTTYMIDNRAVLFAMISMRGVKTAKMLI